MISSYGQNNYELLTGAPVGRAVLAMAVPTVISMLSTSVYNIIDTYFVSTLGTDATTAVGVVFPVMMILQAFGFFFGHGAGNCMAISLGSQDKQKATRMASEGLMHALATGLFIAALGLMSVEPLSRCLGGSPSVIHLSETYLKLIFLSAPFVIGSFTLNLQLRMQGAAKSAMAGIVSGMLLNCLLDPLFIFVFDLGIAGIGLATLLSQATGFFILLILISKSDCPPSLKLFRFKIKTIQTIFEGGFPSLVRQGLGCLTVFILNVAASSFGDEAIAAMTITIRISFLILSVITGLAQGFQPLCGYCFGAGLFRRIRKAFNFTVIAGTIFLTSLMAVLIFFTSEIMSLFSEDPAVIEIGENALFWQFAVFPVESYVIVATMYLQTINRTLAASIIILSRKGIFYIILISILPQFFGMEGVEMAQPLSDLLSFLLAVPIVTRTFAVFSSGYTSEIQQKIATRL